MEGLLIADGRLLTIILMSGYAVVRANILLYFIMTLPDTRHHKSIINTHYGSGRKQLFEGA